MYTQAEMVQDHATRLQWRQLGQTGDCSDRCVFNLCRVYISAGG